MNGLELAEVMRREFPKRSGTARRCGAAQSARRGDHPLMRRCQAAG
jgi:hypothetical protein